MFFCFVLYLLYFWNFWICEFISFTKFGSFNHYFFKYLLWLFLSTSGTPVTYILDIFKLFHRLLGPTHVPQRVCLAIFLTYTFSHIPVSPIFSKCPRSKVGQMYRLCAWLLLGILNHHANVCLISRNSLKDQCISYPSVAVSSASLCCTKDEGSRAYLF